MYWAFRTGATRAPPPPPPAAAAAAARVTTPGTGARVPVGGAPQPQADGAP